MIVCLEIAALFHSVRGKRAAISKLTYIWTPSSGSYIVFALAMLVFILASLTYHFWMSQMLEWILSMLLTIFCFSMINHLNSCFFLGKVVCFKMNDRIINWNQMKKAFLLHNFLIGYKRASGLSNRKKKQPVFPPKTLEQALLLLTLRLVASSRIRLTQLFAYVLWIVRVVRTSWRGGFFLLIKTSGCKIPTQINLVITPPNSSAEEFPY